MIPKPGGGERPLGIPTIRGRVVQTAVVLFLEPIFEADFEDNVYAYWPQRSAHDALDEVRKRLYEGQEHVVDADVISISYQPLAPRVTREAHLGPKPSGIKKTFSPPYELCLGPAPAHYTLIAESARFWLTGDRSCGSWSSCDWTRRDDSNLCFQFTLQGHDEFLFNDGVRESEGHLSADYQLVREQPRLTNRAD